VADDSLSPRLRRLPAVEVLGRSVRVAATRWSRLLGLAGLDRKSAAPLLIPRCASVHTFGMRFDLDLYWFDERGRAIEVSRSVPPRKLANCRGAAAVLEIPAGEGGEISPPRP
jgi:uncharacterized protein